MVDILGQIGITHKCRVLNDTGSQRNFILERIAKLMQCEEITDDVDLAIRGFNSERHIRTSIVKVPMLIKREKVFINATVVPEIEITLAIVIIKQL